MSSDFFLFSPSEFPRDHILDAFVARGGVAEGDWDYQYVQVFGDRIVLDIEEIPSGLTWTYVEEDVRARIRAIIGEPRWMLSVTYGPPRVGNAALSALPHLPSIAVENDRGLVLSFTEARARAQAGPDWLREWKRS
ncbi:MAG: hypothetical protein AAF127_06760 [Pseudomonadota bacterium]